MLNAEDRTFDLHRCVGNGARARSKILNSMNLLIQQVKSIPTSMQISEDAFTDIGASSTTRTVFVGEGRIPREQDVEGV